MDILIMSKTDINETKPDGTVVARFAPIAPYDTPDAVENLCNAYEQAIANEKIDSLILIPTFICDFLCIHPFYDGNGRMSRLFALPDFSRNHRIMTNNSDYYI